jgi:flavin reductase (DIM6/NTAB) family NADH-FMN oxidoreductase RutF
MASTNAITKVDVGLRDIPEASQAPTWLPAPCRSIFPDPEDTMDQAAKKTVLRHFPYGLYVITVAHGGEEHGMTANWLTQAAFDPPMVVVAVENTSKTIGMIRDAHHFAINVLQQGQRELAGKLGRTSEQAPQKLKGIKTKPAPVSGAPVLADSVGWVECRVVATLPSGDHTLVLGEVVEAGVEHGDAQPLTLQEAGFKYSG